MLKYSYCRTCVVDVKASKPAVEPTFRDHTWMVYVPAGKPVVVQVNGVVPYPEPVQAAVTGLNTQSWYSGIPEPPVAKAAKLTLVPMALGLAGVTDVMLTDATGISPVVRVYVVAVKAS
jgi:hypothetical protein